MKLKISGNTIYTDGFKLCHVSFKQGRKAFDGEAEVRYSHTAGRDLAIADGIGWFGADPICSIVVGRVVDGNGDVLPCKLTEARLLGMMNFAANKGQRCTLEIEDHG